MAELLGRDGIRIRPEAATSGAGDGFGLRVGRRGVELLVMPSVARAQHGEVDFCTLDVDGAEDAVVLVSFAPGDAHLLPRDETGEVALGGIAVGLALFGSVDSLEADFALVFGGVENGDCISIRHLDHTADEV